MIQSRRYFHHIVPIHAGGTDDPSNLKSVTLEEHAEAHRLLFEQYGRWQDRIAWLALSGMMLKEEIIHEIQRQTGLASKGRKLRPHTEEEKLARSLWTKGQKQTENAKRLASIRALGRKHTEEQNRAHSLYMTGRKRGPYKKRS